MIKAQGFNLNSGEKVCPKFLIYGGFCQVLYTFSNNPEDTNKICLTCTLSEKANKGVMLSPKSPSTMASITSKPNVHARCV
jgi:hypothetical protein